MCGIAGVLNTAGGAADPSTIRRMIAAVRHRGPDASGFYTSGSIALGHARLSIIDLAGGAQPMQTADGSFAITFNGEIFNYIELRDELARRGHRFLTRSDTEVILHLYQEEGERCVERLNGQWAFAIWDQPRRRLFLSRDRMGVRPLFYTQTPGAFRFASEVKALLASGVDCRLDLEALDQIFTFWSTLPGRTAFRDIRQLPPGHSLVVENGRVRLSEYWRIEPVPPADQLQGEEHRLAEELLHLLEDATRIRLRSDVPVGAYLSGGLDSTLITALAKRVAGRRLRTFSVAFEDPQYDESPYQREASAFLGTEHSQALCSQHDIAAAFPEVVWHSEQPLIRTAPAPLFLLSRLVRANGFKVVLTGEGADELFGGYDIFKETKIRRFWGRNPASAWRPLLLKRLYPYMPGIQRQPTAYLKRFFHVTPQDLENPYFSHLPRWNLTARIKNFLSDDVRAELRSYDVLADLGCHLNGAYRRLPPFQQAEYLESTLLLPGYILSSQGDRVAMAHAVEGRYPFLDHRVVAFAARLSPQFKMKVLDQKRLLKRAASGLIPERIRTRHKQPYRAPEAAGFFAGDCEYVEHLLSPGQVSRDGVFSPSAVAGLVAKFKSGRPTSAADNMALAGVLSTQILLDRFVHRREPASGEAVSSSYASRPHAPVGAHGAPV